jgi:hypothetical protein
MMDDFDYEQLNPGIRDLVKTLHELGYETSDSGDGKTNIEAGMDWGFDFRHVCGPIDGYDMITFAVSMKSKLLSEYPDVRVEVSWSTDDGNSPAMFMVQPDGISQEDIERLAGPQPESGE